MARQTLLVIAWIGVALVLGSCERESTSALTPLKPTITPLDELSQEVQRISGVSVVVYEFTVEERTNLTVWLEYEATDSTSGKSDSMTQVAWNDRSVRFALLYDAKRDDGVLQPAVRFGDDPRITLDTTERPVGVSQTDQTNGMVWDLVGPEYVYRREGGDIDPTSVKPPETFEEAFIILSYKMHETVTPSFDPAKKTEDTVYIGPTEKTERTITIHVKGRLSEYKPAN